MMTSTTVYESVNSVITRYMDHLCESKNYRKMNAIQKEACKLLEEADFRIGNDPNSDVSDLHLMDAVRIVHNALGWPANEMPNFTTRRDDPSNQRPYDDDEDEDFEDDEQDDARHRQNCEEYWLIRDNNVVLRSNDKREVSRWIRMNGVRGLKVLVPIE